MRYSERSRTTEVFPRGRGALVAAAAIAAALALVVPAAADITLTSTPDDLVQMGEFTTVSWAETIRCNVNYGRVPGAYTDETATWGWDSLVFTPENEGMTHGIYYCIVSEIDGSETSDEFVLIVDAPISPSPTAPLNGSTVYETTTELQWDPVDGVSYYHVLVSDHEIDVSEEDGEIVVTGANIVWQAITSGSSIQYGSPDPSGYFVASNGTSPPLMSGFSYHWLVFNTSTSTRHGTGTKRRPVSPCGTAPRPLLRSRCTSAASSHLEATAGACSRSTARAEASRPKRADSSTRRRRAPRSCEPGRWTVRN